ncbi:MAG: pilus assembly protein TadG-related protein [Acetobacteraceae bacterium]
MLFGATALLLIGFVALGTEAGNWYAVNATVQHAADAAAMAGAAARSASGNMAVATAAARQAAQFNGYGDGGGTIVTVTDASTAYANSSAVRVQIEASIAPILLTLFSSATPAVKVAAVGVVKDIGPACLLATSGGLTIGANQHSYSCIYASNAAGADSIRVLSSVTGDGVYGYTTVGTCPTCGTLYSDRPAAAYQPSTTNPYKDIYNGVSAALAELRPTIDYEAVPPPSGSDYALVPVTAAGEFNGTTYAWQTGRPLYVYTSDVVINANTTVTLVPGLYIFLGASLRIEGGRVQCMKQPQGTVPCDAADGVTIILAAGQMTDPGRLVIGPGAEVALHSPATLLAVAPNVPSPYPLLNGMLFYRPATVDQGGDAGNPAVDISGSAGTHLLGGMYFPNAYVRYGANYGQDPDAGSSCVVLVAATIDLTTTPSSFPSGSQCTTTPTPRVRAVRLAG